MPDAAIRYLRRAVDEEPDAARLRNDLAVGYLVAARAAGRPDYLPAALEEIERALSLDSTLAAARFNRALVLEALFLDEASSAAWRAHADAAPDTWRSEAVDRAERAERRWATTVGEPRVDPVAELMDTLLPELAAADSAAVLVLIERAEAATVRLGDPSLAATIRALRVAVTSDREGLGSRMQNALREYFAATAAYRAYRIEEAREPLRQAARSLDDVGLPLVNWAEFYLALCDYQATRYEEALAGFRQIIASQSAGSAPYLTAWCWHMVALITGFEGRLFESVQAWRRAGELLDSLGPTERQALAAANTADAYAKLGMRVESWRSRLRALASAPGARAFQRGAIWNSAARRTFEAGEYETARQFVDAAIPAAVEADDPALLAGLFRRRAALGPWIDRSPGSADAIREARAQAERVTDATVRRLLLSDIDLVEMELADPSMVPENTSERLREYYWRSLNLDSWLRVELVRIRSYRAAGHFEPAGEVLRDAIARTSRRVAAISDPVMRAQHAGSVRRLFEETIRHQLNGAPDPRVVLADLETLRASRWAAEPSPSLFDSGTEPTPDPTRYLEPGTAFVGLATLDDRLAISVLTGSGFAGEVGTTSRRQLVDTAAAFRSALAGGDADQVSRLGRQLFTELLQPVWDRVREAERIVFLPDDHLQGVPFGALVLPDASYLVAGREVLVAPSLTVYRRARERAPIEPGSRVSLVGFGDPTTAPKALLALPAVEEEIASVHQRYPDAHVLLGSYADRASVLAALRRSAIFHFAGHAVSQPLEPQLSWLATAGSVPGEAQPLLAEEIMKESAPQLRLVVLSGCRTVGAASANEGGLLGLAEAFLLTGASGVVGSLWDIADGSTTDFFARFHAHVADGVEPARALRLTQLEAIEQTAHGSYAWAAFQFIGAGSASG